MDDVRSIANTPFFRLETSGEKPVLFLRGDWTLDNAAEIDKVQGPTSALVSAGAIVDCQELGALDTSGAVLVRRYGLCGISGDDKPLRNVREQHKHLFDVVDCAPPLAETEPSDLTWYEKPLAEVGEATEQFFDTAGNLLSFIGLVLTRFVLLFRNPSHLRPVSLFYQMDAVGLRALGIVGLITFLIGGVMVNQGAIQLQRFGAEIFVIDMLGITHFRELGVLMTAIILAGRSGSAFTAEIGSMRLNEEVDAMLTLGMNPIDVLVLPRLLALLLVMPLLTFYADMMGIFGGILVAWIQLDINPANFILYFRDYITVSHFWVGMMKAPFFATVIAMCGCYQGLTVAHSADKLGEHTTKSVVQSIFLVILLDAILGILFTTLGL